MPIVQAVGGQWGVLSLNKGGNGKSLQVPYVPLFHDASRQCGMLFKCTAWLELYAAYCCPVSAGILISNCTMNCVSNYFNLTIRCIITDDDTSELEISNADATNSGSGGTYNTSHCVDSALGVTLFRMSLLCTSTMFSFSREQFDVMLYLLYTVLPCHVHKHQVDDTGP